MKILCFGEILFDVFKKKKIIGGAPLNLAAHLSRIGAEAFIISAVGFDEPGDKAIQELSAKNISDRFVSRNVYPTGYCTVELQNTVPSYKLCEEAAFDHITENSSYTGYNAFCFGTLAQRGDASRRALYSILDNNTFDKVFCDINIRSPYHNRDILIQSLSRTNILKISREEAHIFSDYNICKVTSLEVLAASLSSEFDIETVIVTLDKDGAMVFENGDILYSKKPVNKPVSTVGAGDSFSACFLYNKLRGIPLHACLDRGVELSDYVVTQLEAVPDYPDELMNKLI